MPIIQCEWCGLVKKVKNGKNNGKPVRFCNRTCANQSNATICNSEKGKLNRAGLAHAKPKQSTYRPPLVSILGKYRKCLECGGSIGVVDRHSRRSYCDRCREFVKRLDNSLF